MDFAIKLGWKSMMKGIFPKSIDGDLLKLLHLSNGFSYLPGAPVLKVGDRVTSTSRITSVTNSDSGKTVSVSGTIFLLSSTSERTPVMEVKSAFLYRGKFDDFSTTFDKKVEPAYSLTLKTNQDIAVLKSKDWFEWFNDAKPMTVGSTLIFRTSSEYRFKSKDSYSSVECNGSITLASEEVKGRKAPEPVGEVAYSTSGTTRGNPVIEFLKRQGKPLDQPVLFESPYTLTSASAPSVIQVPKSNLEYSNVSGDVNPIHVNPYFADYAGLPDTITHGMWCSAATRRYVEQVAAENKPERFF